MTSAFFILVEAKKVDSLSVIKLGRFVVHSVAKRVKIMKINFRRAIRENQSIQWIFKWVTINLITNKISLTFQIVDENGKRLSSEDVVELLIQLVDNFKKEYPLFLGMKVILAIARNSDSSSMESKMQRFVDLQKKYPNFLVGFDLVGQEDLGKTLNSYVGKLKEISQNGRFFFHAGETNWFNTDADVNLIDAVLMNTKRIGHGYSLYKHPILWAAFKEKDIAIEISPISNQVLHLVQDLRNHPAAFYISENVPIVVREFIFLLSTVEFSTFLSF